MTSLQFDEIILAIICTPPFIGAALFFALALIRGGKVEE